MSTALGPVVVEAAVTPLRKGAPAQTPQQTVEEAAASLSAGAAIIHHHHDFTLDARDAIEQIIGVEQDILARYPSAYLYADYLRGDRMQQKNAHLQPMVDAGVLRMIALDPGLTQFGHLDENGLPSRHVQGGTTFPEAVEVTDFAARAEVPLSVGIYEPGNLRWAVTYAKAGRLPAGSMIKLYFGGDFAMGGVKTPAVNFGMYPTKAALDIYLSMLDGTDLPWIVSLQGGVLLESPIARYALERGGHLRVGVEDTAGATEMTNSETVLAAIDLANAVGRPIAQGPDAVAVLTGRQIVAAGQSV
jgi:3-keto-5-aminohexanoate cleavage enzyme